jgi:hypothetical protein
MSLQLSQARRYLPLAAALVALVLSGGVLSGCFTPLYGVSASGEQVSAALADVAIVEQETRINQLIRNQLISTMSPPGVPRGNRYLLEFASTASTVGLVLERNTDVSRQLYKLNVAYVLKDNASGQVIHQGRTFSHVAYDRIQSEFSNIQSQINAEERAAIEVGDDIRTRIATYLSAQ